MNDNQEIGQGITTLQKKLSIVDIIESKSALNLVKSAGNEKLPLVHEQVLLASVLSNTELIAPKLKVLSMLEGDNKQSNELDRLNRLV